MTLIILTGMRLLRPFRLTFFRLVKLLRLFDRLWRKLLWFDLILRVIIVLPDLALSDTEV